VIKLFDTDKIQGFLYGFLLNQMGFNTSDLKINLKCFNAEDRKFALIFEDAENDILKPDSLSQSYNFNLNESLNKIDWALSFWKGKRKAISTKNPNKCKKCQFIDKCTASILK